ncbi:MAG: DUF4214 domain-containing protein, partial [Gemmataceae bacterium]|nr:DUF4214 domain-containing protein [Gemmataceae bacterium]
SILGFSELLQAQTFGPLTEKQARYVTNIHTSGRHLLALITDLLDLSRVEAGKIELYPEPVHLREAVEAALTDIQLQAEPKGLALDLHVDAALPPLTADPLRLKQILYNLLSNAVKFTPDGGRITVTVAGGGEVNTTNNTANDVTPITHVADLTIAMSHSGNFTVGGTGTYTITVSNIGGAATDAPVTISDMLPAGLTYAGPATVNGWTISVDGQTITATRMDVLASGASFEALTLTVSVASDAPASFINTATVSGGGQINLSNDATSDVARGQTQRRRGATAVSSAKALAAVLAEVANGFTHSNEYLTNLVTQYYLQLLHRTPSAAEVNSWVGLLEGGLRAEQVLAGFTSSAEYYLQASGTDQAWVDALYHDVLGRGSDTGGEAGWLSRLASGTSRFAVAHGFTASVEHRTRIVAGYYQRFLGRTADVSEVAGWVNNIEHGMADEQVIAAFLASDEFYVGHGNSIQGWLNGAYQVVFERVPDPNGFNYWEGYVQEQLAGS